jgi:hypothetical protein
LAIGDSAADGYHHLGLRDRDRLDLHGLVLALDRHPADLVAPVDLRVVLLAVPLRSVVGLLLADLPVVPVLVLQVVSAAVLVSGLLPGSEAIQAVRLQAHLAVAQALAQADLVVVLLAHLRVQVDPTVVLQQLGHQEAAPVQDRERRCNPAARWVVKNALSNHYMGAIGDYLKLGRGLANCCPRGPDWCCDMMQGAGSNARNA